MKLFVEFRKKSWQHKIGYVLGQVLGVAAYTIIVAAALNATQSLPWMIVFAVAVWMYHSLWQRRIDWAEDRLDRRYYETLNRVDDLEKTLRGLAFKAGERTGALSKRLDDLTDDLQTLSMDIPPPKNAFPDVDGDTSERL